MEKLVIYLSLWDGGGFKPATFPLRYPALPTDEHTMKNTPPSPSLYFSILLIGQACDVMLSLARATTVDGTVLGMYPSSYCSRGNNSHNDGVSSKTQTSLCGCSGFLGLVFSFFFFSHFVTCLSWNSESVPFSPSSSRPRSSPRVSLWSSHCKKQLLCSWWWRRTKTRSCLLWTKQRWNFMFTKWNVSSSDVFHVFALHLSL